MKKTTLLLITLGVLALIVGAGIIFLPSQIIVPELVNSQEISVSDPLAGQLAGVPDELRQLTIPYLRARDYESNLNLGEVVSETDRYTAYLVTYDADGLVINGLLSVPKGEAPTTGWPSVILVHGYLNPATYQTDGTSYRGWWQGLANTGEFVVFKPDLRGHGESEGRASGAYYSSDYIVDVLAARAALARNQEIPIGKIGLWGHSMAGNILLRAAAARVEIPALALWAGAVYSYQDFAQYGITDHSFVPRTPPPDAPETTREASFRTLIRQFDNGKTDYTSPFWWNFAPTNFLAELQGAILIEHAADDDVVSINYSRDLNQLLEQTKVPHQFSEYPHGGHNLTGSAFNQALRETVDFFRQYLQ